MSESAGKKFTDTSWQSLHPGHQPHLRLGLNTGVGGVLLGYLAIAAALREEETKIDVISRAADYVKSASTSKDNLRGLFSGGAGAALAMGAAYNIYHKKAYLDTAFDLLEHTCHGKNSCDFFYGNAGMAYAATNVYRICRQQRFLRIAGKHIAQLTDQREAVSGIMAWRNNIHAPVARYETGAAHGISGIALAVTLYGIEANHTEHIQTGIDCFKGVYSNAINFERGYLRHELGTGRHETTNKDWCHGAAGYLWAMIQLPQVFDELEEEIQWAISVCAHTVHLSNPTYCHGMAGSLELWRLINATRFKNRTTQQCYNTTLYQLVTLNQKPGSYSLFAGDEPNIFSPDLWLGYTGAFASLALAHKGCTSSILSGKWD